MTIIFTCNSFDIFIIARVRRKLQEYHNITGNIYMCFYVIRLIKNKIGLAIIA